MKYSNVSKIRNGWIKMSESLKSFLSVIHSITIKREKCSSLTADYYKLNIADVQYKQSINNSLLGNGGFI